MNVDLILNTTSQDSGCIVFFFSLFSISYLLIFVVFVIFGFLFHLYFGNLFDSASDVIGIFWSDFEYSLYSFFFFSW